MVSDNFSYILNSKLSRYAGEWIAVAENKVIARATSASEVIDKAEKKTTAKKTIMKVPHKGVVLLL